MLTRVKQIATETCNVARIDLINSDRLPKIRPVSLTLRGKISRKNTKSWRE